MASVPEVGYDRDALETCGVKLLAGSDLRDVLERLRAEGVRTLLVEGGGRLVAALMEADLVDRVHLISAPTLLGDGVRAFPRRAAGRLDGLDPWIVTDRCPLGEDMLVTYDRTLCLPES